ncbi:D-2-hydroxyacid dehydrogenase family protein [Galactobacter sp.]|uniref:D-2-hydroxyacid dehydrogenase family protein n=1 Tax=Galactobacter sp. TaxID=2676125 RepID=UPI0025C13217|nr:D-2-hydroxyacid dehydrogenase family protein [Galactobacter sp.]
MRICILDDYQSAASECAEWERLAALGHQVDFLHHPVTDTEALVEAVGDAEVLVAMRERTGFDAERFGALTRLRLLVTTGRANASIDLEAAADHGITVCNTDSPASATVELTWSLILGLVRHLPHEVAAMRRGRWQSTVGSDLDGATLGVVGLGRIGSRVAQVGQAFGMNVVAWSQNLTDEAVSTIPGVRRVDQEELFASADVVSVHYKLSPRSAGLIGADQLGLMKPSAILVNTARGPLVDNDALVQALDSGAVAGAALDVYDQEPLPADHPLRDAPNLLMTPHLGYVTDNTYRTFYGQALEDIEAWLNGSPIRVLA